MHELNRPFPWQDRPQGSTEIIWRYSQNPIIQRDLLPTSNSIFNSAVVPFGDGYAGVFRCDDRRRRMLLHAGFSADGLHWNIDHAPIRFQCDIPEIADFEQGYDPRVVWIDDRYYITWCNIYHGPTIGVAWTNDFKTFHQLENALLPYNRNGVLFPRKINGRFALLSRPSDRGHTPFGDIFYSESPDLCYWGKHRHVMSPLPDSWQSTKIGAGPAPIETPHGWLLIYHGVLTSCNGFVYSFGAALLDKDEPWKIKHRAAPYLMSPQTLYELVGDVPSVVFPCAALLDEPTGRLAIYYGCADTVTAVAFAYLDDLIAFAGQNP
ncbi:MAG: glycoside hydrolase family 130 protein [Phycisphaerales bacterium]|jgi:beta-1,4-mannooligosaccharide/beta-1,4-mannosyl-N-acetylglucosamine phosphorylase|nr:glycoside hydrolase family 130 protein [Phycisphaerales bacterium]